MLILGLERHKLILALDRTNWKLGKKNIKNLVLALLTQRFRVPLMLSFLPHGGTSDCEVRSTLIDRFVRLFGAARIEILLADREFIGVNWLQHLNKNSIPFAIRLKANKHDQGNCLNSTRSLR